MVAGDTSPFVTFNGDPEKRRYRSEVQDSDTRTDLALLVVANPPRTAAVIEPSSGGAVTEGAEALAAGYPGETNAKFTVLRGAVSSISGTKLSISPATDEGFSGGPVLADERVIGVVFEHTRTFGNAIPTGIVILYLRGLDVRWGSDGPTAGALRVNAKDGLTYVWIPPGKFTMGCSPGDTNCDPDEKPREVTIDHGYWMGQTLVTQGAYKRVTGENPSFYKHGDQCPVEKVD